MTQHLALVSQFLKTHMRPAWVSPRLNVPETLDGFAIISREKVVKSTVPLLSCRLFQTHPPWSRTRRDRCRDVCRDCLCSKVWECPRYWIRWGSWAHTLWEETSATRPKSNTPCEGAGVELAEGKSSDGGAIGLGASVGNGVENGEENGAASKVPRTMDEVDWLLRETRHNTGHNLSHNTWEDILCKWRQTSEPDQNHNKWQSHHFHRCVMTSSARWRQLTEFDEVSHKRQTTRLFTDRSATQIIKETKVRGNTMSHKKSQWDPQWSTST